MIALRLISLEGGWEKNILSVEEKKQFEAVCSLGKYKLSFRR
jgi:hypothetical protein